MYFDTIDFKFFRENIEGVGQRLKSRLRWYKNKDSEELEISYFTSSLVSLNLVILQKKSDH